MGEGGFVSRPHLQVNQIEPTVHIKSSETNRVISAESPDVLRMRHRRTTDVNGDTIQGPCVQYRPHACDPALRVRLIHRQNR